MVIKDIAEKPIISPGALGEFDDSGCSLGCVVNIGESYYIYYLGWNLLKTVPWMNTIGLAIWDTKDNNIYKYQHAPIIDRSNVDPYSLSYPFVLSLGNEYKMWYGSHVSWGNTKENGYDFRHYIKFASSKDGINWERCGCICLGADGACDYAFARPSVVYEKGIFKMWYSYRGSHYRIGYAESIDGVQWRRMDSEVGLTISSSGWDSKEICYPMVFDDKGVKYMLYCGNGYGQTGFGLAVQE